MKNEIKKEIEEKVRTAHALRSNVGYSNDIQIVFAYEKEDYWRVQSYNEKENSFANWKITNDSIQLTEF